MTAGERPQGSARRAPDGAPGRRPGPGLRGAGCGPRGSRSAGSLRPRRPRRGKEFPADSARCRFLSPLPRRLMLPVRDAARPVPLAVPATPPASCSPGSCSSGRPAATAARPRGACSCYCGRWCGARRAATGGGRRSDCCTPGRGPTQVTPGRPRRPRGSVGPLSHSPGLTVYSDGSGLEFLMTCSSAFSFSHCCFYSQKSWTVVHAEFNTAAVRWLKAGLDLVLLSAKGLGRWSVPCSSQG